MLKKILNFFLDSIQALVLALSFFVLLYLFIAQPNQVHGLSMYPNFHDAEFLLTEKLTYHTRDPNYGDVVIFKAPPSEACAENECEYIKRVVAIPGDTVKVADGKVWLNGSILEEPYIPEEYATNPGSFLRENRPIIVPPNEYLLLGDNRPHSRDGREFGTIAKEEIVGRAFFRYWPIDRLGLIDHAN